MSHTPFLKQAAGRTSSFIFVFIPQQVELKGPPFLLASQHDLLSTLRLTSSTPPLIAIKKESPWCFSEITTALISCLAVAPAAKDTDVQGELKGICLYSRRHGHRYVILHISLRIWKTIFTQGWTFSERLKKTLKCLNRNLINEMGKSDGFVCILNIEKSLSLILNGNITFKTMINKTAWKQSTLISLNKHFTMAKSLTWTTSQLCCTQYLQVP